jgi:hypothetical protein
VPRYVRFVVGALDLDSNEPQGIFQAIADLRRASILTDHEEDFVSEVKDWFNQHLEKPSRLSTSKGRTRAAQNRGISWFKDSAKEHLNKVRELVAVLEHHDVHVEMLRTERPGYIVYEDEFQIVAEPFSDSSF